MELIPEDMRYCRKCYFCGVGDSKENPVAYKLDIDETRIAEETAKFLGDGVYCCKTCLAKEWIAT